jgi:hypothetical protein
MAPFVLPAMYALPAASTEMHEGETIPARRDLDGEGLGGCAGPVRGARRGGKLTARGTSDREVSIGIDGECGGIVGARATEQRAPNPIAEGSTLITDAGGQGTGPILPPIWPMHTPPPAWVCAPFRFPGGGENYVTTLIEGTERDDSRRWPTQ